MYLLNNLGRGAHRPAKYPQGEGLSGSTRLFEETFGTFPLLFEMIQGINQLSKSDVFISAQMGYLPVFARFRLVRTGIHLPKIAPRLRVLWRMNDRLT